MTVIFILLGIVITISLLWLFTSGRGINRWFLYRFYDRLGIGLYPHDPTQWEAILPYIDIDAHILDVGTAAGSLPLTIAAQPNFVGHVTGIDWSLSMIEHAREQAINLGISDHVHFQVARFEEKLPYQDNNFEVIISLGFVETLPNPEHALSEFWRVLSESGMLILSCYKTPRGLGDKQAQAWYKQHLENLGFRNYEIVTYRQDYDLLIARKGKLVSAMCDFGNKFGFGAANG